MLALVSMLSVFASCLKNDQSTDDTTGSDNATVSTEPLNPDDELDVEDDLPETMDFGGRVFNVLARIEAKDVKNTEIAAESTSGSNVDSAVYQRNIIIQTTDTNKFFIFAINAA